MNTFSAELSKLNNNSLRQIEQFWQTNIKGKCPIIETVNESENNAYFFWEGTKNTISVFLFTGATGDKVTPLSKIGCSHYYYVKLKLPAKLRTLYSFLSNLDITKIPDVSNYDKITANTKLGDFFRPYLIPDPMNNKQQILYDGDENKYSVKSVIEMPKAGLQPWNCINPKALVGKVDKFEIESKYFKQKRTVWIYSPANYNKNKKHGFILQYDGQLHKLPGIPLPNILDNLIHAKKIKPSIAILVDSIGFTSRNDDFIHKSDQFYSFINEELIPWIKSKYNVSDNPSDNIVSGESASGFYSLFTGLKNPEIFGNILCNSPTVLISSIKNNILEELIKINNSKIKVYMTNGTFEDKELMLEPVKIIYELLKKNKFIVNYNLYCGEHDFVCWQGEIAKALCYFIPNKNE